MEEINITAYSAVELARFRSRWIPKCSRTEYDICHKAERGCSLVINTPNSQCRKLVITVREVEK